MEIKSVQFLNGMEIKHEMTELSNSDTGYNKLRSMSNRSYTMELDNSYMDKDMISKLVGVDSKDTQQKFTIIGNSYTEVKVQCRKHKSKRINKKWIKRYGYRIEKIPYTINFPKCMIGKQGDIEVLACDNGNFFEMKEV